jgi:hypothetical protein
MAVLWLIISNIFSDLTITVSVIYCIGYYNGLVDVNALFTWVEDYHRTTGTADYHQTIYGLHKMVSRKLTTDKKISRK